MELDSSHAAGASGHPVARAGARGLAAGEKGIDRDRRENGKEK
jgi:hypothetical protein